MSINADNSLLDAARRMDRDALIKIFDQYSRSLYSYALRLCSDPVQADFVVGDVFAKLLDQFSMGSGPSSNLRAYLYEMAYHLVVDDARRSQRALPLEWLDAFHPDMTSVYASIENRMMLENVMYAIQNELSPDQRHVIILRFLEGFNLRETASIMGKEVNNVKVIQNRAMVSLRKALSYVTA